MRDKSNRTAWDTYNEYLNRKDTASMANINDIYSSNVLKAADLNRKRRTVTISEVEVKDYQDGPKLVLHFEGTEKTFTLNKTNAMTCASLLGDDYNQWTGQRVILRPDVTNYPAPNTPCIRVDSELPDDQPVKRVPAQKPEEELEEIPF